MLWAAEMGTGTLRRLPEPVPIPAQIENETVLRTGVKDLKPGRTLW
jgi:hypothetical protein